MKRNLFLIVAMLLAGFLTACSTESTSQLAIIAAVDEVPDGANERPQTAAWETAVDEQGAVTIAITPVDLSVEATTLAFEVAMDTHSVDLSMDLAALATVTTDNGRTVPASLWDAVPGGHHVSGVLTFPAIVEDTAVLAEASQLTLTITDVDAPSRSFSWTLTN